MSYPIRRRGLGWVLGAVALLCVVAVVIGGIFWWVERDRNGSADEPLIAGQLTGAYPSAPSARTRITASEVGGEKFISPNPTDAQYGSLGSVHDDRSVVTLVGSNSVPARHLVGFDATSGRHWVSAAAVNGCSDTIVDHQIVCYDDSTLTFFDTTTGNVRASVSNPLGGGGYGVALNSSGAYLRKYDGDALAVAKVSLTGKPVWTKRIAQGDGLPAGDFSSFTATAGLVASAQANALVLDADDGREIVNRPGASGVETLADGSVVVLGGTYSPGSSITYGPVIVVRPDGSQVEVTGTSVAAAAAATPHQRDSLLVDGKWTPVTGATSWASAPVDVSSAGQVSVLLADDREVVLTAGQQMVAVDTATGQQKWSAPINGYASDATTVAVTDGTRIIGADASGGLRALNLTDGTAAWTLSPGDIGAGGGESGAARAQTLALGDTLVTLTADQITVFAPTGGPAVVPGSVTAQAPAAQGTVTPCAAAPTLSPTRFRTVAAGLVVTMKVVAGCSGGDVLSGAATRIAIGQAGALVASGIFDFAAAPVAIPSSDDAAGILLDLTYPPGSFFRTPDTLNGQAGQLTVDCDRGSQSVSQLPAPQGGSTAAPHASSGVSLPPGTDVAATCSVALRKQADSDRAFITTNLNNRWLAQLSSKRAGLVADGKTWDDCAILDEFLALRLRFDDVRMLYSDEWSAFSERGWWVTVAALTFPGPDQANAWCGAQGFDGEHCFAKLVSTTASSDGSTRYR